MAFCCQFMTSTSHSLESGFCQEHFIPPALHSAFPYNWTICLCWHKIYKWNKATPKVSILILLSINKLFNYKEINQITLSNTKTKLLSAVTEVHLWGCQAAWNHFVSQISSRKQKWNISASFCEPVFWAKRHRKTKKSNNIQVILVLGPSLFQLVMLGKQDLHAG